MIAPGMSRRVFLGVRVPDAQGVTAWILFPVLLVLSWPFFAPSIRNVAPFDESYYVDRGRLLLEGQVPELAANPGVAAFYAVLQLPLRHSPSWLLLAASAGHLVIVTLLWWATLRLARELGAPLSESALLLLVVPSWRRLLENPSDGLYASLSALSFGFVLAFRRRGALRDLEAASFLAGLAALSRNDGFALLLALPVASLASKPPTLSPRRVLASAMVPYGLVLGAYFLAAALGPHGISIGLLRRTYDAFEQGEGVAHFERYPDKNPYVEGYAASKVLYGTGEDNNYSILRAIRRNPAAFAARVRATIAKIPAQILSAYGGGNRAVGLVMILLTCHGAATLVAQGRAVPLLLMALWWASLGAYMCTFYREGYFLLSVSPIVTLASLGAVELVNPSAPLRGRILWSVALASAGWYEASQGKAWFLPVVGTTLLLLWALVLGVRHCASSDGCGASRYATWALVLPLALVTPLYSSLLGGAKAPGLGRSEEEAAARFLTQELPKGETVATYLLRPVMLARMRAEPIHADASRLQSPEDLASWLRAHDVKAVLVDTAFTRLEPTVASLVDSLRGTFLLDAYSSDEGTVQVFLFRENPSGRPSR